MWDRAVLVLEEVRRNWLMYMWSVLWTVVLVFFMRMMGGEWGDVKESYWMVSVAGFTLAVLILSGVVLGVGWAVELLHLREQMNQKQRVVFAGAVAVAVALVATGLLKFVVVVAVIAMVVVGVLGALVSRATWKKVWTEMKSTARGKLKGVEEGWKERVREARVGVNEKDRRRCDDPKCCDTRGEE